MNTTKEKKNPITVIFNEDGEVVFKGRSMTPVKDKNAALEPYGKQVYNYGRSLKLLPDDEQIRYFNQTIGNVRFVKKDYLHARQDYYNETKGTLSVSEYKQSRLPKLKEEYPFLTVSDKFALESGLENVDDAFSNFLKGKSGYPKYPSRNKPSGNKYTTKYTNNNIEIKFNKDGTPVIKLPKAGEVRFVIPKGLTMNDILQPNTRILKATISRSDSEYYVSVLFEVVIDKIISMEEVATSRIGAADLGIKDFMIMGNNLFTEKIANPRFIRKNQRKLRRLQQSLSRKQYDVKTHTGSKNWYKAKAKIAKLHHKIANQRKDFHHKLSSSIAGQYDVFILENLNVKGMVKNHHLAKEISSCGWYNFTRMLTYKMERKGGHVIKVDRWYASSKTCSCCGYKNNDLTLKIRQWTCPECGTFLDRDINAKENILSEGIRILKENGYTVTSDSILDTFKVINA